jgi:hypothetical protein
VKKKTRPPRTKRRRVIAREENTPTGSALFDVFEKTQDIFEEVDREADMLFGPRYGSSSEDEAEMLLDLQHQGVSFQHQLSALVNRRASGVARDEWTRP